MDTFIWCLVGNVIGEHKKLFGTKAFTSNTKVFCFPPLWGDAYENIKVIGRHRKTGRTICMIMPSKLITNWRLKKVYQPDVVRIMKQEKGWKSSDENRESILKMSLWLNKE